MKSKKSLGGVRGAARALILLKSGVRLCLYLKGLGYYYLSTLQSARPAVVIDSLARASLPKWDRAPQLRV